MLTGSVISSVHAKKRAVATGSLGWKFDGPQAKINYIDLSEAPKVKVYVSFVDKKIRPVDIETFVEKVSVIRKLKEESEQELFAIVDGEAVFPELKEGEEAPDEENPPTLTLVADEERGLAMVVIVPGYASEAYRDGPLGPAMKSAIADLLKSGKNHSMHALWVSDAVEAWISGPNYNRFEVLADALGDCEKSLLSRLETQGEVAEEGEEPKRDPVLCGLTKSFDVMADAIVERPYEGFYPHLFGLRMPAVAGKGPLPAEIPKRMAGRLKDTMDDDGSETMALPALTVAMETLIRDAEAGQPRVIVIVGDGRDGYVRRVEASRDAGPKDVCAAEHPPDGDRRYGTKKWRYRLKLRKAREACVEKKLQELMTEEQQRFASKLGAWLGLARSAGIQIHTVSNEEAQAYERERLEILALRTGGTYRHAQDINELAEFVGDLGRELNEQMVLTFVDKKATGGAAFSYQVEITYKTRGAASKTRTELAPIRVPMAPTGMRVWWSDTRAGLQDTLGKGGFLALLIGVGLLLALLLFVLLKKIFGKKAKGLGGKGKGLKKGLKGGKKALATGKKFGGKAKG